jgi:predicted methyltransferase
LDYLPSSTRDLIKELEKDYPDIVEIAELTPYEQGLKQGAIKLIRHLKQLEEGSK